MPQADIITIKSHADRHPDYTLLQLVANWRVARAKARLVWAEYDQRSIFGTRKAEPICPHEDIEAMLEAQGYLAKFEPATTLGAQVMLEVVADIMASAQLDPDGIAGEGPTFEMIVNIARSLSKCDVALEVRNGR